MEFSSCRLSMLLAVLCASSLLIRTVNSETSEEYQQQNNKIIPKATNDTLSRRQDNAFDFLRYLTGRQPQQNLQQTISGQQQLQQAQSQQPLTIQHEHQLQQQQLAQQQLQQQQQLQRLQQQQLLALQQQQQAPRSNDGYQDNVVHQQQQLQGAAPNRDGQVGIGGAFVQPPKQIGITIGSARPPNVIGVGNILTLLPRIINILSAGGKVMFGAELGNNFYFGPVGAKPLYG